ncbi:MAG TPA: hypothetical protein ENH31_03630 [Nitrospirae bacterium]|nr:hypothetical protein BMS3Abin10_01736 [bacterium BMS3Abin10]GBE39119.1 hypothetical protein BMS3Bbin08_01737 [bacterium BMS3Bbin08]HDH51320.1 hypothetical protein [Nitrospirota bacterium]HDK81644.1 hypothetical protein [Nitrospirota bacterium]
MLAGFNNNIVYRNDTYHVQTENGGPTNPVISTVIYRKGAVVASKKLPYADIMKDESADDTVKQLMENQHKNMIKALMSGRLNV